MSRVRERPWSGELKQAGLALALLWLIGASLRVTLLAVPPLLPTIHQALALTETGVGLLTGLPMGLLAATTVIGSLLVARLGAREALLLGLVLEALGGALRGLGASALVLYSMTVLMGLGIAICQPALPLLVMQWTPRRTDLATALYSNGMLVGEIVAAALTAPLLLGLADGSWALGLLVWSIPVGLTALAVWLLTPASPPRPGAVQRRWWPDWRSGRTWRLGLALGCGSITYFGSNTFIPEYLHAQGQEGLIAPALTSLNVLQLPASFLIAALPSRLVARRGPFVVAGGAAVLGLLGLLLTGAQWTVLWSGLVGFGAGAVFILSLALPPRLSAPHEVHLLSAAMLTIAYVCGLLGPLIGGALWDLTGLPAAAFAVIVAANLLLIRLAASLALDAPPAELG